MPKWFTGKRKIRGERLLKDVLAEKPRTMLKALFFKKLDPEIPNPIKKNVYKSFLRRKKSKFTPYREAPVLIMITNVLWRNKQKDKSKRKTNKEIAKGLRKKGLKLRTGFLQEFSNEIDLVERRAKEPAEEIIREGIKKRETWREIFLKLSKTTNKISTERAKEIAVELVCMAVIKANAKKGAIYRELERLGIEMNIREIDEIYNTELEKIEN